jgi:hypothetical protein
MMRASSRRRALGLELLLCAAIVAGATASCLRCVPALAFKARLAAVFVHWTSVRNDSVERHAETGEWPMPADAGASGIDGSRQAGFAFASAGEGMVASGTVDEDPRPFALSFVPAVPDGGAHVRWLCGRHRAPAGWQAASAPRVLELPFGASFGLCRDGAADA